MSDSDVIAYCSWCYELTRHAIVVRGLVGRTLFRCRDCKKPTVICRACDDMARGSEKVLGWQNQLCHVHNGSIPNFKHLRSQFDCIADFRKLYVREHANIGKASKLAGTAIHSGAILTPFAAIAAPAVGGAVGATFMGLNGAAATNAGLALLGGGSLAAGGFGMAGGASVVAGLGGLLGGALGGAVGYAYYSDIQGFDITLAKPGVGPAVIVINGFLCEGDSLHEWNNVLKTRFPNNPWYHVKWESKRLKHLGAMVGPTCSPAALKALFARAACRASKAAAKKMAPVMAITTLGGLLKNAWHVAFVKAGQTGILLADILCRVKGDEQFILVGHSLGCAVIYSALSVLAKKNYARIVDVHLLGGAVGKHPAADWVHAASIVSGSVNNYYSTNDWVLKLVYRVAQFFLSDPIGYSGLGQASERLNDVDVSAFVDGHCSYKKNAGEFLRC